MAEDRTALLEREQVPGQPAPVRVEAEPAREQTPEQPRTHGPRRWSDPDEKLMLYGLLFFFGLGMYALVFVTLGMWLTP